MTTPIAMTCNSSGMQQQSESDKEEKKDEWHPVQILVPVSIFYYREAVCSRMEGRYRYRLEAIESSVQSLQYECSKQIERTTLMGSDLAQLQFWNKVCIPQANAKSIQFIFSSNQEDQGTYVCQMTSNGFLKAISYCTNQEPSTLPVYDPHKALKTCVDGDVDTYYAASTFTIAHEYVQSRTTSHFIHVGASLVPCGTLFVPLWMNDRAMRALLCSFKLEQLPRAEQEALMMLHLRNGHTSFLHCIPRTQERHR